MSDTDRTRSPSPAIVDYSDSLNAGHGIPSGRVNGLSMQNLPAFHAINRETPPVQGPESTSSQRLILKTRPYRPHGSSPAPPRSSSQPLVHNGIFNGVGSRRSRPETTHQKAVTMNRKMRIDSILFKKLLHEYNFVQDRRKQEGRTKVFRAMKRIRDLPDMYDSEDDREQSWGPGGLLPNFRDEPEDYGEEAVRVKKVLDRAVRRLVREETVGFPKGPKREYLKRKRKREDFGTGDDQPSFGIAKRTRIAGGPTSFKDRSSIRDEVQEEELDDIDLALLGERREDEQIEAEMDIDSGGDGSDWLTEDENVDK